jgi:hypothetical protein
MVILLLSGCTAVNVRPVETESKIAHVCVKDCSDMCFEGDMMSIIRDGFDRHGITTQVYTDNLPSECKYHLTYFCERTWDMATYMHYAELKLFDGQNQIGYAEYRLKGKGGFSLMKWESTKDKMDPVIDQLLGEYPTVNMAPKKE